MRWEGIHERQLILSCWSLLLVLFDWCVVNGMLKAEIKRQWLGCWPDVFHIFRRARWSGIFAINSIKKYLTPPLINGIHVNKLSDLPMRPSQGWYYIIWSISWMVMIPLLWKFLWEISIYVQSLYPATILLGFIVVEIVFGLYFTIELYCRPLGSNWQNVGHPP